MSASSYGGLGATGFLGTECRRAGSAKRWTAYVRADPRAVPPIHLTGLGGAPKPKRDLHRFVKWPQYVRLQRQKRVLSMRLKVPPVINQFVTRALDKNSAEAVFKLMMKYRPEDKKQKAERLKAEAAAREAGKEVRSGELGSGARPAATAAAAEGKAAAAHPAGGLWGQAERCRSTASAGGTPGQLGARWAVGCGCTGLREASSKEHTLRSAPSPYMAYEGCTRTAWAPHETGCTVGHSHLGQGAHGVGPQGAGFPQQGGNTQRPARSPAPSTDNS